MLAKRQNSYPEEFVTPHKPQNTAVTDSTAELKQERGTLAESVARVSENVIAVDFANLSNSPVKTPWPDYEEFFPTIETEATEAIATLTPAVLNRRCYWLNYWPSNQVFRIKEIDLENNSVYLNLVYRWVSVTQISLLKALTPNRPPKDIELAHLAHSLAEPETNVTH